jgi:hypothetical protein
MMLSTKPKNPNQKKTKAHTTTTKKEEKGRKKKLT